jgi:hypothetical protein
LTQNVTPVHTTLYRGSNLSKGSLMENCVNLNLINLNQGNKPNSVICNKKEVTDLILGSNKTGNPVNDWYAHMTNNFC